MSRKRRNKPPRVLVSFNTPRLDDLHFVYLFGAAASRAGVRVLHFSPTAVLWRRFDLFNLHWPELLISGSTPSRRLLKRGLLLVLLFRIWAQRIPVVYTVHNVAPHDPMPSPVARWFYSRFTARWVLKMYLNEAADNDYNVGIVALHGRYEVIREDPLDGQACAGGIPKALFFGNFRRYKGVERLVEAVESMAPGELSLELRGSVSDPEYASEIEVRISQSDPIHADFAYQSREKLLDAISGASIVVLPYRDMYNSGAALLALSVGTPVLVPRTPATEALAAEVGTAWCHLFEPDADAPRLAAHLRTAVSNCPSAPPDLSRRSWTDLGEIYRTLFQEVIQVGVIDPGILRQRLEMIELIRSHSLFNDRRPDAPIRADLWP